jgi:hypothetical protein
MNQEKKDILNKYVEIKKEINILSNIADELNKDVLEIMQSNDLGEITFGNDKLSIGSRRSWSYTPLVKELKDSFEERKKYEERTGEATYVENFYPIFSDSDNKKKKK